MRRASILLLLIACGDPAPAAPTNVEFTHAPLPISDLDNIIALGNLNPPDHSTPTDHIYLVLKRHESPSPVFAPVGGQVAHIWHQPPYDPKVTIRVTPTLSYYFGHIFPRDDVKVGARVVAGQVLGTTTPNSRALDLGVVDESTTLAFANPARYSSDSLHCVPPLRFFAEPLRSTLRAMVQREGPDKDGRIDLDVPGTLAGNWFREGLPAADSAGPKGWSKSMSFAVDVRKPSQLMIAIGGELSLAGLFTADGPAPASVTSASGAAIYTLTNVRGGPGGKLTVKMLGSDKISISANADPPLIYVR